jgi:superfamily II DNA or RNA helicase
MARLVKLEPGKGFLGADLFLPKDLIIERSVESAMTFGVGEDAVVLSRHHPHHLEVPRNAFTLKQIEQLGIPLVDLRPKTFRPIKLKPKPSFHLRDRQLTAMDALSKWGRQDTTLNLACGRGKTVLAWYRAAAIGGPVLFLAPQRAHLLNAMKELEQFYDFGGTVGWLGDGKREWDRDIVLGTVQSVAGLVKDGALPWEFHRHFALAIFDEAHHMSASYFGLASNVVQGQRLGLTAEKERTDGLEGIFLAHLGPIVYSDIEPDLAPVVVLEETGLVLSEAEDKESRDKTGEVHMGKLRGVLGENPDRNALICSKIQQDLDDGRTVYVISHSPKHVEELHRKFPGSGLILQSMKGDERLRQLGTGRLVFTTVGIGSESYNRKDLDTIHIVTPPGARDNVAIAFNQCVGRVLRDLPGKPQPIARLYWDKGIEMCDGLVWSIIRYCHERGWVTRGVPTKRGREKLR